MRSATPPTARQGKSHEHESAKPPLSSQPPTAGKHMEPKLAPQPIEKPALDARTHSTAYKPAITPTERREIEKSSSSASLPREAREMHGRAEHPGIAALREKHRELVHDLPGRLELARSRELMKQVYAEKMRDESIAARRLLAAELLNEAILADDNAADQYVLLTGAIQAGRDGRDLAAVLNAVEAMAARYDIDMLTAKLQLATEMALVADAQPDTANNVQSGLILIDELAAAGNYDGALKLCEVLRGPAASDGNLALLVQSKATQIEGMKTSTGATPPAS
jgi:hypothetical protein